MCSSDLDKYKESHGIKVLEYGTDYADKHVLQKLSTIATNEVLIEQIVKRINNKKSLTHISLLELKSKHSFFIII